MYTYATTAAPLSHLDSLFCPVCPVPPCRCLIRTIKGEEVNRSDYEDYIGAYGQLGRFPAEMYTPKRIHSSLGY